MKEREATKDKTPNRQENREKITTNPEHEIDD